MRGLESSRRSYEFREQKKSAADEMKQLSKECQELLAGIKDIMSPVSEKKKSREYSTGVYGLDGKWIHENETREFREGPFVEEFDVKTSGQKMSDEAEEIKRLLDEIDSDSIKEANDATEGIDAISRMKKIVRLDGKKDGEPRQPIDEEDDKKLIEEADRIADATEDKVGAIKQWSEKLAAFR